MNAIKIYHLDASGDCLHHVAVPPGISYTPLKMSNSQTPAKEYDFILDPFQREAILCLENNHSVLVSAHTSAGKTVVAEYAVAMSLKSKQRVIYTTPIKALSNQKYRELYNEFSDVGLITGDVTINPTASCLIMTTEILRSMLYRGSDIIKEVAWVIYDEIHYMRDKERGVVWEESIILLPDHIRYVFLSATIPNAKQFAEWISYIHKQPCHIICTTYRPTPLQHFIFPAGGEGIQSVVNEKGSFSEENFERAMSVLKDKPDTSSKDQRSKEESSCFKIVNMVKRRSLDPIIVFCFSRKECEFYALQFSKLDFNSDEDKATVQLVYDSAIMTLQEEDRVLPQVKLILPLLLKGIGIHHSGLLPIVKETIEILFSEGLIKALCATETFAMGLNMPARSVLFTSASKFDGKNFRWITSGEYVQMSGRAGRRGLDDKGTVILMVDDSMTPEVARNIIMGQPDQLNSAYHLSYNMILNMLRVEGINPEYVLEKSFFQFQNYSAIPNITERLKDAEERYSNFQVEDEVSVSTFDLTKEKLEDNLKRMLCFIQKPQYLLPFLCPGRLVKIVNEDTDFGWGVVINFKKKKSCNTMKPKGDNTEEGMGFHADVLLRLKKGSSCSGQLKDIKPCSTNEEEGDAVIVPVYLLTISSISKIQLHVPSDLRRSDSKNALMASLKNVLGKFPAGLPLLDPIEDMGIKEEAFLKIAKEAKEQQDRLNSHPFNKNPKKKEIYAQFLEREKIRSEIKQLSAELKQTRCLLKMEELKKMKRVLKRLKYIDSKEAIEMKGRVACEISSGDNLVVTELLLNGVFNEMTAAECCSLLSCFVFQEKAQEMPKLTEKLSNALSQLKETARQVATVSKEMEVLKDEDEYIDSFKPHLMGVVLEWAKGTSFVKITQMTNIYEGSIIRCLRRLEEFMRQMVQAAKTIGNEDLEKKFTEGIQSIKRNIVFSASLYL